MEENLESRAYTCIQCGKCTGGCPESKITPLNVRLIVRKTQFRQDISGSQIWYCTSCGSCLIRCPRDVKPAEIIFGLRGDMVESGGIPISVQRALENTFLQKNPWGRAPSKRADWVKRFERELKHVGQTAGKRLLFSCCSQAYDPRCMVIPQNVANILDAADIEFGILYEEESCCGNEIRRMGEKGLFEELLSENMEKFERYEVKEIIALSPHCMNALKNEYGISGIRIVHYTEFLWEIIEKGLIEVRGSYPKRIVYHDPCFLGKQNKIFDPPRKILSSIPGITLIEFSRSRENSLCCEGGGGRMFYEVETIYERNSMVRVKEAKELGAEVIATACPFCLLSLEEQAKEFDIPVKDISEILSEVLI